MAVSAVINGRNAAKSAPKAIPRTTSASTMPSTVLPDSLCPSAFSMSCPPSATCRPRPPASWATFMTFATEAIGRSTDRLSKVTVAKATVPFRLI